MRKCAEPIQCFNVPKTCSIDVLKVKLVQIQLIDERVDNPHRVVLGDVVVEAFRQQDDLASVLSLDESLHAAALLRRVASI